MLRIPITFAILLGFVASVPAGAGGPLSRKPKVNEVKARVLVETLRADPDEKARRAAAVELGGADPRVSPDVAPALVRALRGDASAAVRAGAADALRELGEVFAQAGVTLEEALESDPSPLVRSAARRTLWEYHLNGYRPATGGSGAIEQTVEPPVASPAGPRPVVALVPALPVPEVALRLPEVAPPSAPSLPPVVAAPGPRLFLPNVLPGPRAAVRSLLQTPPPVLNVTGEPPVAKRSAPVVTVSPPVTSPEPPLKGPPEPDYVPTLPPFRPDLPSVVTPPWATPLPVPKLTQRPK